MRELINAVSVAFTDFGRSKSRRTTTSASKVAPRHPDADHSRVRKHSIREIGHTLLTAVLLIGCALTACLVLGLSHLTFH
jgi:hypothetical protein